MAKARVVIMGAAGRDFHNFNTLYRGDRSREVVCFTATQIPGIDDRRYPASLAGPLYPRGIPIRPESELRRLIERNEVEEVVFSYSDVPFQYVMRKASEVVAAGADFKLLGAQRTMLKSRVPVVAVVASRTGCGKSQTARAVCAHFRQLGLRTVALCHPMPYGNLVRQRLQRFASLDDLKRHQCSIEEMEEFEPHLEDGGVVFTGIDTRQVLREAEREADVLVWDGGNNDTPFVEPRLTIAVVDPHRAGHESCYYPGETNVRLADVVIVNKVDSAERPDVERVIGGVRALNDRAKLLEVASEVAVENPASIRGRRVLVVEDGPTLTHGEMTFGAGTLAARRYGARSIVDPRPFAVRTIEETYARYPGTGRVLPAVGYGPRQLRDLAETINRARVDAVILATPVDLTRVIRIKHDTVRVRYGMAEASRHALDRLLDDFVRRHQVQPRGRRRARSPRSVRRKK